MKSIKLLILLIIVTNVCIGQSKDGITHISEDFSSNFPPSGWEIDANSDNWMASESANAGGTPPEARFSWNPQFNGTSRLISPVVDLSEVEVLALSFKHFIDHFGGAYTVGVATRSDGGDWSSVWSMTGQAIHESRTFYIENEDVGSSTFQFCFYFSGNSYNINDWYIDDIVLFTPFAVDLESASINNSPYISQGEHSISATVKNVGVNPITSFDIEYQFGDEAAVLESVSDVNLSFGQGHNYVFSQKWNATPGSHNVTVNISNANGEGDDDNPSNNSTSMIINVASQGVENLPLFESFTSSTCPPCYTFNVNTFTPFLNANQGNYAIVKYQMNWPGSGDPYYTEEGGVRRNYYGVSGVPSLYTGGEPTATTSSGLNAAFAAQQAKESFFSITASADVDGTTIHAEVEVMPYISAQDLTLQVIVTEKETTGNVGTNGETSFKYVMMKMLPDASGTNVNFVDGEEFSISFTQNLASTNVEENDDLMIVVFIQNDATKEVLQSFMLDLNPTSSNVNLTSITSIYPNPARDMFTISVTEGFGISKVEVYSLTGSLIYARNFDNVTYQQEISITQPQGIYLVKTTLANGQILINKLVIR